MYPQLALILGIFYVFGEKRGSIINKYELNKDKLVLP